MSLESNKVRRRSASNAPAMVKQAREAEVEGDLRAIRQALKPVWADTDEDPATHLLEGPLAAEVLRLAGFYLGYAAHTKNRPDFEERGKDLLTRSVDRFEALGLSEGAAQAKINLAWRYQQQGAIEETRAILSVLEAEYADNRFHHIYVQVRINQSIIDVDNGDLGAALEKMREVRSALRIVDDTRLKAKFTIESGLLCRRIGRLDEAERFYKMALKFAAELGNRRFEAIAWGNLAYLFKELGDFDRAHQHIDRALEINHREGQDGFVAHNLDTKSLICLDEQRLDEALEWIDRSISLFRDGEDYRGFADALFNRARILIRLGMLVEMLDTVVELAELAQVRLGEKLHTDYMERIAARIYAKRGDGLHNEVRRLRKELISDAVAASDKLSEAALILGISPSSLSDMMRRQYPNLFKDLKVKRYKSRRRDISPYSPPAADGLHGQHADLRFYSVYRTKLPQLDLNEDCVVATKKAGFEELEPGGFYLVSFRSESKGRDCGLVEAGGGPTSYLLVNDSPEPVAFDKRQVATLEVIVGYLLRSDIASGRSRLRSLEKAAEAK